MRATYSLWTTPMISDLRGGYRSTFDFWVSLSVSIIRSQQVFSSGVELLTDEIGFNIADRLGLSLFCEVSAPLRFLNRREVDSRIWIQGKLEAYRTMSKRPAYGNVHIDADAVFWKKFPLILEDRDVIAQSPEELQTNFYKGLIPLMAEIPAAKMPVFWNEDIERWRSGEQLQAYNCGFVGGEDSDFVEAWSSEVLRCLEEYPEIVDVVPRSEVQRSNFVWEQWMFAAAARHYGKTVQTLLPECRCDGTDDALAEKWGYTHAFGSRLKNDDDFLFRMERRLELYAPKLRRRMYRLFRPYDVCEDIDTSMLQ